MWNVELLNVYFSFEYDDKSNDKFIIPYIICQYNEQCLVIGIDS